MRKREVGRGTLPRWREQNAPVPLSKRVDWQPRLIHGHRAIGGVRAVTAASVGGGGGSGVSAITTTTMLMMMMMMMLMMMMTHTRTHKRHTGVFACAEECHLSFGSSYTRKGSKLTSMHVLLCRERDLPHQCFRCRLAPLDAWGHGCCLQRWTMLWHIVAGGAQQQVSE